MGNTVNHNWGLEGRGNEREATRSVRFHHPKYYLDFLDYRKKCRCQTTDGTGCFSSWKQTSLHALTTGDRKQKKISGSFIFCYKFQDTLLNVACKVLVFSHHHTVILSPNSSAYMWTWTEGTITWTEALHLCPLPAQKASARLLIGEQSHTVNNRCSSTLQNDFPFFS